MKKSGSVLLRIGILFIVLGFGSLVLNRFNMEFTLLSWADEMQPGFGIVLGLVGVVIVALPFILRSREKTPERPQFAQQPPQYGQPMPGQPYGQGAAGQPLPGGPLPAAGPVPGQPFPGQPPIPGAPQQQPGQPG